MHFHTIETSIQVFICPLHLRTFEKRLGLSPRGTSTDSQRPGNRRNALSITTSLPPPAPILRWSLSYPLPPTSSSPRRPFAMVSELPAWVGHQLVTRFYGFGFPSVIDLRCVLHPACVDNFRAHSACHEDFSGRQKRMECTDRGVCHLLMSVSESTLHYNTPESVY